MEAKVEVIPFDDREGVTSHGMQVVPWHWRREQTLPLSPWN